VDVAALFLAGPAGLAVTKGYNFASNFQTSEGRSEIRTLVSGWKVERGVAQAQDVAMATKQNRVALKGGLDFVNERFGNVTLVDNRAASLRSKPFMAHSKSRAQSSHSAGQWSSCSSRLKATCLAVRAKCSMPVRSCRRRKGLATEFSRVYRVWSSRRGRR